MRNFKSKTYLLLALIIPVCAAMIIRQSQMRDSGNMQVALDDQGQVVISEEDLPVLRYNYQIVYETDEYAFNGLAPNEYIKTKDDTFMTNPSIYAVPRSNYIHPLFGLNGEILTRDWSKDHPHHRGIYWAWPEVDYGKKRSDLHALQKVFARPTGRIKLESNASYAQVEAENLWIMEDDLMPIVIENALIRAYPQRDQCRVVDMAFRFEGLRDSVTIARRGTEFYGGLNIRMMTPEDQSLTFFTEDVGNEKPLAWSDLHGVFTGSDEVSGMMVFQSSANPEYPGQWVEYPELSWVQPTFPTAGTRFPLPPGEPLVLCFRIVIYSGIVPDDQTKRKLWEAYQQDEMPEFTISW